MLFKKVILLICSLLFLVACSSKKPEITNARASTKDREYITTISDEIYIVRANTTLKEGTEVTVLVHVTLKDGTTLTVSKRKAYVKNNKIEEKFDIAKIIEENKLNKYDIDIFQGELLYESQN